MSLRAQIGVWEIGLLKGQRLNLKALRFIKQTQVQGKRVLYPQFQCVGCFSSTHPSNSGTPNVCPTIQLNSDTVYPEIASDSTGEGLSPCSPLHPPKIPVISPGCHLGFWPTGYRLEVPTTPSSFNLLEWLTESRESFYLLDYQFIIKDYNSGTARSKRCIGQGMGEGCRALMLSEHATLPESLPTWKLSKPHPFGVLWRLHYIGVID